MSTNYYWNPKGTPFAQQLTVSLEPLHIGKTAGGWSFMFRAYDCTVDEAVVELEQGIKAQLKVGLQLKLRSWQDWKAFLAEQGGQILDEYDSQVPIEEFLAMVEGAFSPKATWAPSGQPLLNHFDYIMTDPQYAGSYVRDEYAKGVLHWKDAEGYSFTMSEFS